MQKQEKFLFEGHRSTFCIKEPFGIEHPHLHIKCSLYVYSRVQGSLIFKQNSIISIHSKYCIFSDFIVPVIPTSSPHCLHHPHKVPMWSTHPPWLWSHCLHPTWSPHCPHVVPTILVVPTLSPSSPHCLEGPYIIPNPPDSH